MNEKQNPKKSKTFLQKHLIKKLSSRVLRMSTQNKKR